MTGTAIRTVRRLSRPGPARRELARGPCGGARGGRAPGHLRGGAPLPLDAGLGPDLVRALPRGKARPLRARAPGARLVRRGGLEARAAGAAVARPGRA